MNLALVVYQQHVKNVVSLENPGLRILVPFTTRRSASEVDLQPDREVKLSFDCACTIWPHCCHVASLSPFDVISFSRLVMRRLRTNGQISRDGRTNGRFSPTAGVPYEPGLAIPLSVPGAAQLFYLLTSNRHDATPISIVPLIKSWFEFSLTANQFTEDVQHWHWRRSGSGEMTPREAGRESMGGNGTVVVVAPLQIRTFAILANDKG